MANLEAYGNTLINGGSAGGGGHRIQDKTGTDLPQQDTLQFGGYLSVTDDTTDYRTVVKDIETVSWATWQTMTTQQKQGKHWVITDAPEVMPADQAIYRILNQQLTFTNLVATITDANIGADDAVLVYYNNKSVAEDAMIDISWAEGVVTFTAENVPASTLSVNVFCLKPSFTPEGGSGGSGHVIKDSDGTEMAQQPTLKFGKYMNVTNDSTNGQTVVDTTPTEIQYSDWLNLTTAQKQEHEWILLNAPDATGGGGHTIWNRIKTALTQRSKLWFKDATVSDVSADGASSVEVITSVSESDFDNLATDGTADGIYEMNSSDVTPLMADNIGFDPTGTGLTATNTEAAIKEVNSRLDWKRYTEDNMNASITLSGVTFREVMVDVGNASGTSALRFSMPFIYGYAAKKRVGYYATSTNYLFGDVTYDGNATFTIVCFGNTGTVTTTYTTIYYR